MAILRTYNTPVTLDALDEEIIFGPGYIDVDLSGSNTLYVQLHTAVSGTWTITVQQSLDGTNWVNQSVSPATGSFGATFSAAAQSFSNILSITSAGRPYVKIKMTSYTDGEITMTTAITADLAMS